MRMLRALVPLAVAALIAVGPAAAGRGALAVHGWAVHPATVTGPVFTWPLPLGQLPVSTSYQWSQSPFAVMPYWLGPAPKSVTLAQLPLLTTYPWAQPATYHQHVLYGQPWSL